MYYQRRRANYGTFLLLMQLLSVGFDNIPPVTLGTILLNVLVYVGIIPVPTVGKVCISPVNVLRQMDLKRLFLATIVHADDMHLYYNMISFLWKGRTLERILGSTYFAYLLLVFSILTSTTYVFLSHFMSLLTGDTGYDISCAVGFSGVIFALKVLTTEYTESGNVFVMGTIPVPSKLALWVELILISLLVPEASFIGHLAGILIGLAYVSGPLRSIMNIFYVS